MSQDTLRYSVAMRGQGAYNQHSQLQKDTIIPALHLLHEATVKATDNPLSPNTDVLRVVEYGAAHGANRYSCDMPIFLAQ